MADDRVIALQFAVGLAPEVTTPADAPDVVGVAGQFYQFLTAAVAWAVTVRIDRASVGPFTIPIRNGAPVPTINVTATDNDNTITFAVHPQDDHQQDTPDQLTVASSDTTSTVGTMVVNADTHGAVVTLNHVEGTFTVTFSDPSATGVEDLVFDVTVGPGATAALSGTATVA